MNTQPTYRDVLDEAVRLEEDDIIRLIGDLSMIVPAKGIEVAAKPVPLTEGKRTEPTKSPVP